VPRHAETIDDRTPLTASRIDIAARIGWLLRTTRSVAGLSLREMSSSLKTHDVTLSATSLSRIESEGLRSTAALDGYAAVLGLPAGALRAPVDVLSRAFSYGPPAAPEPGMHSLERFSESFEAIAAERPSGGAWLAFARHHSSDGGFGLPTSLMEPHVRRLAEEMCRSVGMVTFLTRYEALARLRCSAYGDLVGSVLQEMVLEPHHQALFNLMSVLSERPTAGLLHWAGTLLGHESVVVVQGASYALQSMLVVGGLRVEDWESLVPQFTRAWHDDGSDATRRAVLTDLCAALPPLVQSRIRSTCRGRARPASRTAGLVPQPEERALRVRALDRRRRLRPTGAPRGAAARAAPVRGDVRPTGRADVDLYLVHGGVAVRGRPDAVAHRAERERTRRGEQVRGPASRHLMPCRGGAAGRGSVAPVPHCLRARSGGADRRGQRSVTAAGRARSRVVGSRDNRAEDAPRPRHVRGPTAGRHCVRWWSSGIDTAGGPMVDRAQGPDPGMRPGTSRSPVPRSGDRLIRKLSDFHSNNKNSGPPKRRCPALHPFRHNAG
jgi:hypothetical protein